MSIRIFTLAFNEETKEITYAGDMPPAVALNITQGIVIQEAVKKAQAEKPAAAVESPEPDKV
jgi:hypothetical protein